MTQPAIAGPTGATHSDSTGSEPTGDGRRVLVVDDEPNLRHLLGVILERLGYQPVFAQDGGEALAAVAAAPDIGLCLCDIRMPRVDGLTFLDGLRAAGRDLHVVMMSAYGTTDTAVEALGRGAVDYISKPFRADEIRIALERVVERERLEEENRRLREAVRRSHELEGFIGRSKPALEVMDVVAKVAEYPSTVLITGESGTGKELLARAVHARSPRSGGPFVAVNCAAIPPSLLESELFGHERGAFTGAVRTHAGLFEQAHGGTLLLDEIGDMPAQLQTRLLRVLEDGRVRRVGGSRDIDVDVRLVASTAADLEERVRQGQFRRDLFFRLNVVHVRVPPLRGRREDIPLLADALVERASRRLGRAVSGVDAEALRHLVSLDWPGNVRQLENALERAVLMTVGATVSLADLPPDLAGAPTGPDTPDAQELSIKLRVATLERDLISRALKQTGGNRSQAARLLEISYKALVYKIRDYGLGE